MLSKEALQNIIDQFDEDELKRRAIFGISSIDGASECSIRANKEGLEIFALELLKSARESDEVLSASGEKIIWLDRYADWLDENSDIVINYIEPIGDNQKLQPKTVHKKKLIDKVLPYGCGCIGAFLLISLLVGLISIFEWLF
jgi:hypothetical protein